MILNATFFAQIINFLVAYVIFSKLFLRPAIALIQREDAAIKNQQDHIATHQQEIKALEALGQQELISAQQQLQEEIPSQTNAAQEPVENIVEKGVSLPPATTITTLSSEITEKLVRRLI